MLAGCCDVGGVLCPSCLPVKWGGGLVLLPAEGCMFVCLLLRFMIILSISKSQIEAHFETRTHTGEIRRKASSRETIPQQVVQVQNRLFYFPC
jgi:hypothetical protein